MIYFETATKEQLLNIALHEDCSLDYKYAAARELEIRKWQDSMLIELVRMWGSYAEVTDIAVELGIPEDEVRTQLKKRGLYKKRVKKWQFI